ncbi:MAG: acyl-CoA dehydrogenase family protein [Solirubrobacteraceae bacterium]
MAALHAVSELVPLIARRAAEIERDRAVPDDLLQALRDAGCLRLVVGAEHGGEALALPETLAAVEALSRAHGTVGWLVGQVTLGHAVVGYLPADARAEIYADCPDRFVAGAAAPKGRAARTPGGWTVSGRWPLVSGSCHAEWLYLQCLVEDVGPGEDGVPGLRCVVLPADRARVLDTYRGIGLRGSASNDVKVSAETCPERFVCDLTEPPDAAWPILRHPVASSAGLFAAAVMLGTAAGAVEAISALAAQKRPSFSTRRLADSPLAQNALGEASMTLAAGRSLLHGEVAAAETGGADDAWLRSVGVRAAAFATEAVQAAYALGGSSSVIDGSPLERRLRDVRALTQHATLSREHLARLGERLVRA